MSPGLPDAGRPAAVRARGWGWRHAGRRDWAVRGLDLDIAPGERVLLLGASGAGKSTLLAGLAGLLGEQHSGEAAGSLLVDGRAPADNRHRAGLLLQDPDTQLVMNRVGDDVVFGPENFAVLVEQLWPLVDDALRLVGFPYGRDRLTSALSGGEKQRLALAGVLAIRPGLLLLDEPTANLDPQSAADVVAAVAGAVGRTGATLVVVEHRVTGWVPHVDRAVVLAPGGGVLTDGEPGAVFAGPAASLAAAGAWVPGVAAGRSARDHPTGAQALRASGVGFSFRGAPRPALRPTDLVLHAGELVAVGGRSGSGKSTLALLMAGLTTPAVGTVRATGVDRPLHRWPATRLAGYVGTVFQDPEHQFVRPTVRAELELAPRRLGWPAQRTAASVDALLQRLRLDRLAAANPYTLSGGQKRRLSVATALVTAPRVVVLDEPTFGQDPVTWRELAELIVELRDAGTALLVVSHDQAFVDAVADRRLCMIDGRLQTEAAVP